ncbi:hypothetical protein ZWY2020_040422 [Hordeum vulgare]|nr:hypothetical protein ZWY2020_040422 [Hordeum vulgare]
MTYPEQRSHHSHRSSGMSPSQDSTSESGDGTAPADRAPKAASEVLRLGWGQWYTLKELEASTEMFADENVIGEGGYGIVYHGVLEDGTQVGVKNLLNNRVLPLPPQRPPGIVVLPGSLLGSRPVVAADASATTSARAALASILGQ